MTKWAIKVGVGTDYVDGAGNSTNRQVDTGVSAGNGADPTTVVSDLSTTTTVLSQVTSSLSAVKAITNVSSALSTLVADGATPTQAHVSTAELNYVALSTSLAAVSTAAVTSSLSTATVDTAALKTALTADVEVIWDSTKITTITQLKKAFDAALQAAAGGGILTP